MTPTFVLGVLVIVGAFVFLITRRRKPAPAQGLVVPPEPKGSFLLGNALELDGPNAANNVLRLHRTLGSVFQLRLGPSFACMRMWFVSEPALIGELMNKYKPQMNTMPSRNLGMFKAFGARSVMALDGKPWWAHKTAVGPWYCPRNMQVTQSHLYDAADSYLSTVVPQTKGEPVDLSQHVKRLMIDACARCAWRQDISQSQPSELLTAVEALFAEQARRAVSPAPILYEIYSPASWKRALAHVRENAGRRLRACIDTPHGSGDYLCFFADLVRDNKMSFDDAVDELSTLLFGSVASYSPLTAALYFLSKDARLQGELRAQVDALFARSGPQPSFDELTSLPLLSAVVYEGMRYIPSGWLAAREVSEDLSLQDGKYIVPAGTTLMVSILGLHRNEKVYADPESFKASRFVGADGSFSRPDYPDTFDTKNAVPNPVFMPFGFNTRMCPAHVFSLHAMRVAVAKIVHAFELAPVAEGDPTVVFTTVVSLKLPLVRFVPLRR